MRMENKLRFLRSNAKRSEVRDQIKKYATDQTKLGRIAFDEWNFPDLSEDERKDYPLITFENLADEILRQISEEKNPFVFSFATHPPARG